MSNMQRGKFEINIDENEEEGYFEHDIYGEELGGGLWFKNKELIDFDGVSILPDEVAEGIIKLGFNVNKKQFCAEKNCSSIQEVLYASNLGNWQDAAELYKELQYTLSQQEFNDQVELLTLEEIKDICRIGFIALGRI